MKKKILILILFANLLAVTSCNLDGLQSDPTLFTPDQANITFLMNSVEIQFGTNLFYAISTTGMDQCRQRAMTNGINYNNSYQPASFDGIWSTYYATIMPDLKAAMALGQSTGQYNYTGIARVLDAYMLITMVDIFGDIPWSQAFNSSNFAPQVDKGKDLYDTAIAMLNHGIADLAKPSPSTYSSDVFYGGSGAQWTTLAKTLLIRAYNQRRLVDPGAHAAIQAIVTSGDYIGGTTGGKDFVWPYYGNSITNPDTRHPLFVNNYLNGAGDYMSNSLMLDMIDYNNKGLNIQDPRLRYYFYRQQVVQSTDVNALQCYGVPPPTWYPANAAWCQELSGYWGRDHLNNSGTGPDTKGRTIWGIYPVGGKFDNDQGVPGSITDGNQGNGIWPIVTSSFVNFWLAEDALVNGSAATAGTYLNTAVAKSISNAVNFSSLTVGQSKAATAAQITAYQNAVTNDYNTNADQMQVIMKEFWKATFCNGLEMYNAYRRTGHPNDMQPAAYTPTPGDYYRSWIYPAVYITRNPNAVQHADGTQVFWDNNPADPWIN